MQMTRRKFARDAAALAAVGPCFADGSSSTVGRTLFSIWKFATKDGPGIRTVVALKGCPLAPVLENIRHLNAAKRRIVLRCPMIPGVNDDDAELTALGKLADELEMVGELNVEPYVPYGVNKAQRLGLKVYEAPHLIGSRMLQGRSTGRTMHRPRIGRTEAKF